MCVVRFPLHVTKLLSRVMELDDLLRRAIEDHDTVSYSSFSSISYYYHNFSKIEVLVLSLCMYTTVNGTAVPDLTVF